MKVYYTAHDYKSGCWIDAYLEGRYPKEWGTELFVTDAAPETTHIWAAMEYHQHDRYAVFEIDLPHTEAELEPYRVSEYDLPGLRILSWILPWYVVAGHPVKIMEARIEHRTMGVPSAMIKCSDCGRRK